MPYTITEPQLAAIERAARYARGLLCSVCEPDARDAINDVLDDLDSIRRGGPCGPGVEAMSDLTPTAIKPDVARAERVAREFEKEA